MGQLGTMACFQGHWLEEGTTLKKSSGGSGGASLEGVGAEGPTHTHTVLHRAADLGSGGREEVEKIQPLEAEEVVEVVVV